MQGLISPGRKRLDFVANTVNLVVHGNSLVRGASGATVPTGPFPYQLQRLPTVAQNPLSTVTNMGFDGQTWEMMFTDGLPGINGKGALVDALYDAAKVNVLLAFEGHNTLRTGKTPLQDYQDALTYSQQRLSIHPGWLLLHMTTLPACYQGSTDAQSAAFNADIDTYNQILRNNWRSTGAKALIDLRAPGSLFNPPNYNVATFQALQFNGQSVWSPNDGTPPVGQNQWVHLSDIGYSWLANKVDAVLRRLPTR